MRRSGSEPGGSCAGSGHRTRRSARPSKPQTIPGRPSPWCPAPQGPSPRAIPAPDRISPLRHRRALPPGGKQGTREVLLTMPIFEVTIFSGPDEETKARLTREIAAVVAEVTVNSMADVHVIVNEVDRDNWGKGAVL